MPKKLPKNFTVTPSANAGEPAELAIRGAIGDSWDMDEYTMSNTEEEVINALADIPKGTKINLRINSPGGNVAYALGIYNALKRRTADVTTYNEGIACSSASVLMCAGARAVMPKSSVFMIHCASNGAYGNAVDMAKNIELLNTFDKTIAAVLAEKSKKTPEAIMDLMKAESWMTGDEARQNGFADESNDDEPLMNSATADSLARFKHTPQNLRSRLVTAAAVPNPQTTPEISMKKIIAALVAAGITALAADASEDAIANAVTGLADERTRFKTANDAQVTAQKTRVTNRVQAAIDAKKVKAERKDALIAIGVANEAGLDFLDDITVAAPANAAQPRQRGANPAPAAGAGEAGEVESEIATLRESNRTEKDPTLLANNSRRLRELRGHKELFTPAKN
jgi:ATP-dependent Clp endopeptidase proteolytic subunit ClpP